MPNRPNILVFQTDDHGQWASGCYGNREIHSPSMDWLAATGARMTRAFTPCPVCSPARASFWTGKIPSAHGVHDYLQEGYGAGFTDHPGIGDQTTLGDLLQQAGYHTGLVGKWHAGGQGEPRPGFDFWVSSLLGTNAKFGEQRYSDNGRTVEFRGHQAPYLTDQALRFLRDRPDPQPFFLYVGYTDTHTPHKSSPERLVEKYRHAAFSDIPDESYGGEHGRARRMHDKDEHREQIAQYYAAVEMIDSQIGRVIDELDSRGLLDDTLIVYTSDHGHMNGHHGLHCKGNATVPQNLLDESILVPCLLRWPGGVESGRVQDAFVDHCDLHATLLDAAGAASGDAGANKPGRSCLPLLRGEPADWRDVQFCEYGNARMARTGRYKLIRRYEGPNGHFPDEFYDLAEDPRETDNRFADTRCADTIADLTAQLDRHFVAYEDPRFSGRDIARQPEHNGSQPWSLPAD